MIFNAKRLRRSIQLVGQTRTLLFLADRLGGVGAKSRLPSAESVRELTWKRAKLGFYMGDG